MINGGKYDLLSCSYNQISAYVKDVLHERPFRADQLCRWISSGESFEKMSNLPASMIEKLKQTAVLSYPVIVKKFVSSIDGTVKYLFSLSDGEFIESVVMQYEHGYSVCLSTQAGCNMGCRFCASTIGGKVRDLLPGEIIGQIIVAQRDLSIRVSNVVLMGIGEPLDNYDNVLQFLRIVNSEKSLCIGYRHISLSTCGIVDKIYRLAEEDMPITLSVSLHAPNDAARSDIMPVNRKFPLDVLLRACRDYFDRTGRRISFEYTLISGKNDSVSDADELSHILKKHLGKRPFHVNLIPVNAAGRAGIPGSDKRAAERFKRELEARNINATVRRTLGSDINASCGQLRHSQGAVKEIVT